VEEMLNNIREYQLAEIRSIDRKRFQTEWNGWIIRGKDQMNRLEASSLSPF